MIDLDVTKVQNEGVLNSCAFFRGYTFDANHPFHLHGHAFRIVGMERLNKSTEPWIIKQRDADVSCQHSMLLQNRFDIRDKVN